MASVNTAIILGNLGRDPEVRYTNSNEAVTTLSVATSSRWKDKQTGEQKEDTEWHRVVFYGRLAEVAAEYLKSGRSVYIQGRLKTRKWTDKQGIDRYTTEIIGEQLQLLGGRDDGDQEKPRQERPRQEKQSSDDYRAAKDGRQQRTPPPSFSDMEDDIPFN